MRTVRTTMQPDTPIEVTEREFKDLARQGLVIDDGQTDESPALTGAVTPPEAPGRRTPRTATASAGEPTIDPKAV